MKNIKLTKELFNVVSQLEAHAIPVILFKCLAMACWLIAIHPLGSLMTWLFGLSRKY